MKRFDIAPAILLGGIAVLLVSIAIPNIRTAVQRGHDRETTRAIRESSRIVELYKRSHGQYPARYLDSLPAQDAWGHPYRYECWNTLGGSGCDAYAVGSAGKNGKWEQSSLRDYLGAGPRYDTPWDMDIVLITGRFEQWREGVSAR